MCCPLPWRTALRVRLLRKSKVADVTGWLISRGWRSTGPQCWIDPVDDSGWSLVEAVRMQAVREAQRVLEPRGWEIVEGERWRGIWRFVRRVQHPRWGYASLKGALEREGEQWAAGTSDGPIVPDSDPGVCR